MRPGGTSRQRTHGAHDHQDVLRIPVTDDSTTRAQARADASRSSNPVPTPRLTEVDRQGGFSLVELLFAMMLLGILLTLSASALKTFWLRRALDGSTKQVTAQLRQLQQRAVAESHPLVYGARFTEGSDSYTLLRYNPSDPTPPLCRHMNTLTMEDGV